MRSGAINTLTGDTGGPVGPDASENINILGGTGIDVAGVPASSTLTISADGTVPLTFTEDSGSATAALNILNVLGGNLLSTTGAANNVTIDGDAAIAASFPTDAGTGTPVANALSILGGAGVATSAVGAVVTITAGATVPTSFTADTGSATPALNNINLFGGTGLSSTAAGSTVTFDADASVPTSFPTDSGTATPAANALSIVGGSGISTSGSGAVVTVNSSGGGFAWVEVTGVSQAIAVNTGYIANNAGSVTFTLPATAAIGDTFKILGKGAGGWSIAQNAAQTIRFLADATTTGVTGTLTPTEALATTQIICVTADTDFIVDTASGNFTLS